MAQAESELDARSARLTPAAPPPLTRLASALCVVLLSVVVGVLLALAVGGVLAVVGAAVSAGLDG